MNKQNMIEHVESGLSLWSFQKSTWRYWKDNSMAPVHLQQNGTLGLEHRHSTGTTSRCEEHGLPNSAKARQIPDQKSDDFVIPRGIVPILVFPTLIWDQIWGHGDMSWWYWNTPKTSLPCHHRRHQGVGFAQWSCLDEETSFLKNILQILCKAGKQNAISINNFYNKKTPTKSRNSCVWLIGFPNDGANMGKLLRCSEELQLRCSSAYWESWPFESVPNLTWVCWELQSLLQGDGSI